MRILEIGGSPYVSRYAPAITDFYCTFPGCAPEQALTLGRILALRKRLKAGDYDLVVYHITVKALFPMHRDRPGWRDLVSLISSSFLKFHKIGWHYFHYFFRDGSTPLIVIDTQDVPRITQSEARWLDRAQFWFMRELPPNHMNLFLNMDRRSGDVINIQRNPLLRRNFAKIEPFSLGFFAEEMRDLKKIDPSEKIHDVFYAGKSHTSSVREKGLAELRALKAAGVRVFIPETRLSQDDFFRACAQSWLVWSPEGQGWDCYRHYEALMSYSVPLINYPTIEQLWPLKHGEHCLYYRPETGGLTEAVQRALRDKPALLGIAEQGRAYVLQHHARSQLVRHVLAKAGLLAQAEAHLVESK
jgi:hypothetical protein